ncbi:MAG: DegT/DnrJ/EryC1/StrS family aminotransferase [Acidimicrobiales bacterium]
MQERYLEVGFNFRMTDLQAAVGLVQLGRLRCWSRSAAEGRRSGYQQLLADVPGVCTGPRTRLTAATTNRSGCCCLEDRLVSRDEVLERLAAKGVSARRGIMAAHLEPAYAEANGLPLPVTERVTRDSLILPVHHELTPGEQEHIADIVQRRHGGAPRKRR